MGQSNFKPRYESFSSWRMVPSSSRRWYSDNILQPIVLPFINQYRLNFTLYHHIFTEPHDDRVVSNFFEENNLGVMEWPENSSILTLNQLLQVLLRVEKLSGLKISENVMFVLVCIFLLFYPFSLIQFLRV